MIRKFFAVVAMVAVVALVASPAEAGGSGGAKKSVTMNVLGEQPAAEGGIPVIYIPTGGTAPTDTASFFSLGGKVVNPGQRVSFLVAPGTGNAVAIAQPFALGSTAGYTAVSGKVGNAKLTNASTKAVPVIVGY